MTHQKQPLSANTRAPVDSSTDYRPQWNRFTGSPLATLLLYRILYHWKKNRRQPFCKYNAPCPSAPSGTSWREELGLSRRQFESARAHIARRIPSQPAADQPLPQALVLYWTDPHNRTWYQVNEPFLHQQLVALNQPASSARPCPDPTFSPSDAQSAHPRGVAFVAGDPHPHPRRLPPGHSDAGPGARNVLHSAAQKGPSPDAQNGPNPYTQDGPGLREQKGHNADPHTLGGADAQNDHRAPLHEAAITSTKTNNREKETDVCDVVVDDARYQHMVTTLTRLGDADPVGLLARYPADQICAWLDYCLSPAGTGLTNIPGFIRSRLKIGEPAPVVPSRYRRLRSPVPLPQRAPPSPPAPRSAAQPHQEPSPNQHCWDAVLAELKLCTTAAMFNHWFRPLRPLERRDDTLRVAVDSHYAKEWLDNRLRETIDRVVAHVAPDLTVEFVLPPPATHPLLSPPPATRKE